MPAALTRLHDLVAAANAQRQQLGEVQLSVEDLTADTFKRKYQAVVKAFRGSGARLSGDGGAASGEHKQPHEQQEQQQQPHTQRQQQQPDQQQQPSTMAASASQSETLGGERRPAPATTNAAAATQPPGNDAGPWLTELNKREKAASGRLFKKADQVWQENKATQLLVVMQRSDGRIISDSW